MAVTCSIWGLLGVRKYGQGWGGCKCSLILQLQSSSGCIVGNSSKMFVQSVVFWCLFDHLTLHLSWCRHWLNCRIAWTSVRHVWQNIIINCLLQNRSFGPFLGRWWLMMWGCYYHFLRNWRIEIVTLTDLFISWLCGSLCNVLTLVLVQKTNSRFFCDCLIIRGDKTSSQVVCNIILSYHPRKSSVIGPDMTLTVAVVWLALVALSLCCGARM